VIVYFADRKMNILGQASTKLPKGLMITDDTKDEDVESGVAVFECEFGFDADTRAKIEACVEVGNYILRKHDEENEFYTIIDSEIDTKKQTAYIYAEDAGLDLLNEIVGAYEADQAYPIDHYIEKFAYDSGFVIGINEAAGLTRKLIWNGEDTVTARLASVATQFDGCEISFSFDIKNLRITAKKINIFKERGKDIGTTLHLNKEIDNIVVKKTIVNVATALRCTGGTPEDTNPEDNVDPVPITLRGYEYDDGDFYVDGDTLKCRSALARWSRYINPNEQNLKEGHEGHIVRTYSFETLSQATLCAHAVTELKKLINAEVNYEADILYLPENTKIGDRVNIVDEAGELFLSTRLLQLKSSVVRQEQKATLGEFLIKKSGISDEVTALASRFAVEALTNRKAREEAARKAAEAEAEAEAARLAAEKAKEEAEAAQSTADAAKESADKAKESADAAQDTANDVKIAVDNTQEAIREVVKTVDGLQIGARNLIRNSKNLIFEDYYFKQGDPSAVMAAGTLGSMILGQE
jgi:phage minor structural protein